MPEMTTSASFAYAERDRTADLDEATVAVVIVNYRTPELTKRCVAALAGERALVPKLRAIVVDGGSSDGSAAELAATLSQHDYVDWVSFLPLTVNGGFAWANNQAILTLSRDATPPDFVHLLNPDTEVRRGAVASLAREMLAEPRCGAAGSQLLSVAGEIAASAFRFPSPGREIVNAAESQTLGRFLGISPTVIDSSSAIEADWVSGASVMFRSAALRETGLLDDGFFLYFEEVELMHRLHLKGWTVRYVPASRVVHVEAAATGVTRARALPDYWYNSRRRYFALSGGRFGGLTADLAWLAGRSAAMAKKLIGREINDRGCRARDLLRHYSPHRTIRFISSAPAWGDAPGKLPAWMSQR